MSEGHSGFVNRIFSMNRPVLTVILIALVIRIVLSPLFTYDFDVYHWGVIIENFQSGGGLYDIAGYYYTPVWGYFIGFLSMIQDLFLNISSFGWKITGFLPMEQLVVPYHTSIITTIQFNVFMKMPLIISDIVVGILIYWLIKEFSNDDKKALVGMSLWLFCPTVVYMAGVQVQFDTMSALFFLVTVILLYKDHNFLAGMMMSTAVLLKFFPAFCLLVLVGYIFAKHRGDNTAWSRTIQSIAGAGLMALVIMIPQILQGDIMDSLSFIIGRAEAPANLVMQLQNMFGSIIGILGMIAFGIRMFYCRENHDKNLMQNVLYALSFALIVSMTPQYMIVMLPFLIFAIMTSDRRLVYSYIFISIGSFFAASTFNNLSLLTSLSAYTGIIPIDRVVELAQQLESYVFFGMDSVSFMNTIGCNLEFIGMALALLIALNGLIIKKIQILDNLLKFIFRGRDYEI